MANDYTALDYDALLDRGLGLGRSRFPGIDWDNQLVPERWMVEQQAHLGGKLFYLAGNIARESRWGTAVQRRSQIAHAKLVAVTLRTARAARATVTFTLVAAAAGDVVLLAGTAPRTEEVTDPLAFQLLEDLTIPAGQTTATATAENSETHEEVFAATDRPNQEIVLGQTPYLDDTAVVVAANGTFTQVDNFVDSEAGDRHFTVTVDNLDRATLRFGNGTSGALPSGTITITYRTGGGLAGNVPADAIKVLEGTFTDTLGNPVTITVTNVAAAEGGDDRESVAQARERIPRAARARTVAVAREDFEDGAIEAAGVARALALTYEEEPTVPQNTVIVYPVPTAGGAPSDSLKTAVKALFLQQTGYPAPTYRALQNIDLRVQTPLYTTITPRVRVYFRSGVTDAVGGAAVRAALADYFAPTITAARLIALAPNIAAANNVTRADGSAVLSNPLVNFGFYLQDADGAPFPGYPFSDVYNLIRDVPEVARIAGDSEGLLLNGVAQDVPIVAWGFPVLGTPVVINAKTGVAV